MKKLLIVEDDDLSQKVLKMIFIKDYEMDFCESAEEFYEKFSKELDLQDQKKITIDIELKESALKMKESVVSASSFGLFSIQ